MKKSSYLNTLILSLCLSLSVAMPEGGFFVLKEEALIGLKVALSGPEVSLLLSSRVCKVYFRRPNCPIFVQILD